MISVFELFKIGIGPSSSHTVGPMKAAAAFVQGLTEARASSRVARVTVTLFGSLAFTGKGHAVDKAVILGLSGKVPATIDPDEADAILAQVRGDKTLMLAGRRLITFDLETDLRFDFVTTPKRHPNPRRQSATCWDGASAS